MCKAVNESNLASSATAVVNPDVPSLVDEGLSTVQVPVDNVVARKEALDGTLNVGMVFLMTLQPPEQVWIEVWPMFLCETFYIVLMNVHGGDNGGKSGGDIVVEAPVVFSDDTAHYRVPHDGTEVTAKPKELSGSDESGNPSPIGAVVRSVDADSAHTFCEAAPASECPQESTTNVQSTP
ncbi:hypothetical protein Cgig2_032133 [Carnegiea gigantea]|uniref:Uncharacterized protein n=1 Tax=Carnegiea gigantea TaxID=171969 RepID=A0A9Q1JJZ4_9CARY|nr:hypothetical protein Cgig2_032133 [Carnegiea gigantea]